MFLVGRKKLSEHVAAADERGAWVKALEVELEGYVRFGKEDRAAEVRRQIDIALGRTSRKAVTRAADPDAADSAADEVEEGGTGGEV